ncbi:MAG: 50S ribosomal protein L5, large subunit ribosomal protein L5, partial [candidate division WWE3 bacterium GW2011_GWC1_41_7]
MKMKETYQKTIAPKLMKEFKLSNIMEVPRLKKISVNSGMGSYRDSREAV